MKLHTEFKVISRCANVCSKILNLAETQDSGGEVPIVTELSHAKKDSRTLINTIQ